MEEEDNNTADEPQADQSDETTSPKESDQQLSADLTDVGGVKEQVPKPRRPKVTLPSIRTIIKSLILPLLDSFLQRWFPEISAVHSISDLLPKGLSTGSPWKVSQAILKQDTGLYD